MKTIPVIQINPLMVKERYTANCSIVTVCGDTPEAQTTYAVFVSDDERLLADLEPRDLAEALRKRISVQLDGLFIVYPKMGPFEETWHCAAAPFTIPATPLPCPESARQQLGGKLPADALQPPNRLEH